MEVNALWRQELKSAFQPLSLLLGVAVATSAALALHLRLWEPATLFLWNRFSMTLHQVMVVFSVLNPVCWASALWCWWRLAQNLHRTESRELLTTPLRSSQILWLKVVPLALSLLAILFVVDVLTAPISWALEAWWNPASTSELTWPSAALFFHDAAPDVIMGITMPVLVAFVMVLAPRRRFPVTCTVVPALAMGATHAASLVLRVHTHTIVTWRLGYPHLFGMQAAWVYTVAWRILLSALIVIPAARWTAPRFTRLLSAGE